MSPKSVQSTMRFLALLLVAASISQSKCAKILGIIPVASYSHQIPFQPLWRELSLKGHQVTTMTTNPIKDPALVNLTEIDLGFTYEVYKKYNFSDNMSNDEMSNFEKLEILRKMLNEAGDLQLSHPPVQELIHNKQVNFDLVIVEAQLPGMMAFSWRFGCPMIGITTLDAALQYHITMGNPAHPVANPDYNLPLIDTEDLSFRERLHSFVYYVGYTWSIFVRVYPQLHIKLKTVFGDDIPDVRTLHGNMVMLFINTHPIFQDLRPLNPNTIPIGGGIHLKKPEPLDKHIQDYLDSASNGAIFFSLGTNVNTKMLKKIIPVVLETLGEFPYQVLLRSELELENVPKNVAVHKWLPQQDLLRHPNLKLFITQGGIQSLQEAVYNGIPVIGIPFLGDQISNVNKMVKKGYGLKVDRHNVTKESLKEAVTEVMNNPKYREKARELSDIYRDEEIPSLERAIWWVEYVIRHKGATHLRNPVVDMPYWKYFMLDVIGFCLAVLFLFIFLVYKALKFVYKLLFVRRVSPKQKVQ